MDRFAVSHAPFVNNGNDVNRMFLYIGSALMIPAIFGVVFFGISSLFIVLVSVVVCYISEVLFNFIKTKNFKVNDFSFLVTGMILALTFPVKTPIYVVAISAFFSVFVVKQAFGGLGFNKFNPALCGRCLAGLIVPGLASSLYSFTLNDDAYVSLTSGGENTVTNLVSGQAIGGIGTTCIVFILICAIFLIVSKVIDFKIPLVAILAYFITAVSTVGFESAVSNILSGSFIFVCVFMLTDPNTSPDSLVGKFIFSALFGVLSALVWQMGNLGENTIFAVALFINIISPIFDRLLVVKPILNGGYRNGIK